jgi:hypothetical protein
MNLIRKVLESKGLVKPFCLALAMSLGLPMCYENQRVNFSIPYAIKVLNPSDRAFSAQVLYKKSTLNSELFEEATFVTTSPNEDGYDILSNLVEGFDCDTAKESATKYTSLDPGEADMNLAEIFEHDSKTYFDNRILKLRSSESTFDIDYNKAEGKFKISRKRIKYFNHENIVVYSISYRDSQPSLSPGTDPSAEVHNEFIPAIVIIVNEKSGVPEEMYRGHLTRSDFVGRASDSAFSKLTHIFNKFMINEDARIDAMKAVGIIEGVHHERSYDFYDPLFEQLFSKEF